jgi:hypothetical protein
MVALVERHTRPHLLTALVNAASPPATTLYGRKVLRQSTESNGAAHGAPRWVLPSSAADRTRPGPCCLHEHFGLRRPGGDLTTFYANVRRGEQVAIVRDPQHCQAKT